MKWDYYFILKCLNTKLISVSPIQSTVYLSHQGHFPVKKFWILLPLNFFCIFWQHFQEDHKFWQTWDTVARFCSAEWWVELSRLCQMFSWSWWSYTDPSETDCNLTRYEASEEMMIIKCFFYFDFNPKYYSKYSVVSLCWYIYIEKCALRNFGFLLKFTESITFLLLISPRPFAMFF